MSEPTSATELRERFEANRDKETYDLGWSDCRKREVEPLKERNATLLAAAKAALEWICSVTEWEDGVPYVNGRYAPEIQNLDKQLRQVIADAEQA